MSDLPRSCGEYLMQNCVPNRLASEERDRDRIDRIGQSISGLVDELGTFRIGLHVGGTWNQDLHHKLGALQRKMSTLTEKM